MALHLIDRSKHNDVVLCQFHSGPHHVIAALWIEIVFFDRVCNNPGHPLEPILLRRALRLEYARGKILQKLFTLDAPLELLSIFGLCFQRA